MAEPEMRWVMDFILGVRQIHGEMDIPLARKFEVLLQNAGARDLEYLGRNLHYLVRLGGVEAPRALAAGETAPISAVALLGNLEILVPMKGLIDPVAELDRLAKRLRKAEIDMSKLEAKLGNSQFAKNAPPDIVAKDQQRLEELRTEIGQLSAQTARVTQLKNQ
jgi:valyl-tRNA synthetase